MPRNKLSSGFDSDVANYVRQVLQRQNATQAEAANGDGVTNSAGPSSAHRRTRASTGAASASAAVLGGRIKSNTASTAGAEWGSSTGRGSSTQRYMRFNVAGGSAQQLSRSFTGGSSTASTTEADAAPVQTPHNQRAFVPSQQPQSQHQPPPPSGLQFCIEG